MLKNIKTVLCTKRPVVFYAVVVFLLTSITSSFLTVPLNIGERYIGGHDFLPPFLYDSLVRDMSVIDTVTNNGYNVSNQVALLVPFRLFYYLMLHLFKIDSSIATSILFFAIAFLSQLNSYNLLRYLCNKKGDTDCDLIAIVFGVMYFFCPFVVSLLIPGHVSQLFIYAFIPAIIKNLDEYLMGQHFINNNVINIFFLSLLSSASFFNYAVLFAYLLLLMVYTFVFFHSASKLSSVLKKLLIVIVTIIMANLWWLLPSILNVKNFGEINNSSYLNDYEEIATKYATFNNIFIGTSDPMLHLDEAAYATYYTNDLFIITSLIFFILFIYGVIQRKDTLLLGVTLLMLFFAFLSKGSQQPFGNFFTFAYNNVFGFKMFRRPISKFYPIYWLLFIMSSFVVYVDVNKREKSMYKTLFSFALMGVALLNFIFFQCRPETMYTFSVPSYYEDSRIYLKHDSVNSVIVLPTSGGLSPDLGSEFNYYKGLDILPSVWKIPTLYPDLYGVSPDYLHKEILNRIYLRIASSEDICQDTRDLGITHIVWRNDTKSPGDLGIKGNVENILQYNSAVKSKKTFGEIDVYSLRDECRGSLLGGAGGYSPIELLNSKSYYVSLFKPKDVATVRFSKNYDPNWRLIKVEKNVVNNSLFTEIVGIANAGASPSSGSYFNEWVVDNEEGFYVIYYYSQKFVYLGALMSLAFLLFIYKANRRLKSEIPSNIQLQ